MITTEFLDYLDKFRLIVNKKVTSNYSGKRPSLYTGSGATIKDYRIYAPGDDWRLIDWKIYARTDHLYIRRYEEERNLVMHAIVDSSASMNYGAPVTKFEYGAMLGVGFAYLALRENEKMQFATISDNINVFQPRRGMGQLASMIDYLNGVKPSGKSRFSDMMKRYKKFLTSRAFIVLVSDFLMDIEEIREGLLALSSGNHDIKVIQVLDVTEKDLPLEGDVKLRDAESTEVLRTYIGPRLVTEYENKLEQHIAMIGNICDGIKANFYVATTATPIFDIFYDALRK
ncbi:MAG TPA: DUF58 domain-containing protein [Candidatus Nanoarchaeia archaeon]|nr:DUF58 domain-containing protein [Candidatus Nanoarchaeia archaeon]